MLSEKLLLAVVPARRGSKGIPNKNVVKLNGISLIGWAGKTLEACPWLDHKIISTDDPDYAAEGRRYGLDAPFLRPDHLSGDTASAVDVLLHSLEAAETQYGKRFDYIFLLEPTSPLRKPEDVELLARALIEKAADSAVCVTLADSKFNPLKLLTIDDGLLQYYDRRGGEIVARQQLPPVYIRNGICYGVSRSCLLEKRALITNFTLPVVIGRPVANIDEPLDLEWAEFLLSRQEQARAEK